MTLKESLQKIKQKNDRLIFENAALRDDIQYFQSTLNRLAAQKTEGTDEPPVFDGQNKQLPFMEAAGGKNREQRVKDLIAVFQRDISGLRKEIQFLDGNLDQTKFESEKRQLFEKEQEGLKSIAKLEKNLKDLTKRNTSPEKVIEMLRDHRRTLEAELARLR